MEETAFGKVFGRGSWCAVLSSLVFAACGGGKSAPEGQGASAVSQAAAASEEETAIDSLEPTPSAVATTESGWYFCSNQGTTCAFSGTRLVRYGASGRYAYKSATSSIGCNNVTFGDPAPGVAKTCSISSSPSPYKQDAALYNLTFRDEFGGTALDTSKWNDHIWYEESATTPDFGVGDGYLKIWPQKDTNGKFRSRILTTAQKFSQSHGYFEMEAKLPIGRGVWPAFWLLNSDDPENGEPEIDIMEAYPGDRDNKLYWGDQNKHPIAFQTSFYQKGNGITDTGVTGQKDIMSTGDLSAAFHKYALKWDAGKVSYYFDGNLVYTANVSMDRKMYILVDIQCGDKANESGLPDNTTPLGSSNSLQVNYVRAWQFN